MKRYRKHTFEEKLSACQDYLDGKSSGAEIVEELSLEKNGSQFYEWVRMYQTYGPEGLMHKPKNSSYPKEFKIKVVQEYLSGKFSLRELQEKYMYRLISLLLVIWHSVPICFAYLVTDESDTSFGVTVPSESSFW